MLRVVIVEDELHSRESLRNLLLEYCGDVNIEGVAASVDEAVTVIRTCKPDLVFLDVELQAGTGFDVLQRLKEVAFSVVFTTAFEHYAIKAIKFSSIDYLLKPIDVEELQEAVGKAALRKDERLQRIQRDLLLSNLTEHPATRRICLATADAIEFIPVQDILYCEAKGSYTEFVFSDRKPLLVSKHLKEYENLLGDERFMRVHNSYLINLSAVRKFVKSDGGYIVMNNEQTISISPKKREEFIERMAALAGGT